MSVEFSNAYQEILLDNLMAIIKQNFVFQTQLKISEKNNSNNQDLQKKLEELVVVNQQLNSQLSELENYKNKVHQNESAHEEKSRIQTALNEEMKKSAVLINEINQLRNTLAQKNSEFESLANSKNAEIQSLMRSKEQEFSSVIQSKDEEINNLREYISKLESNVSVTKLKKINPQLITKEVPTALEAAAGTF